MQKKHSEILTSPLFMSRRHMASLLPAIQAIVEGRQQPEEMSKEGHTYQPQAGKVMVDPWFEGRGTENLPEGTTVIVPIEGAIIKYDDWWTGTAGTVSIGHTLQRLDANPNVVHIVAQINSGGGTIGGLEDLVQVITNLSTPAIAYIDGIAASAAYWIAAAFPKVYAKSKLSESGSIGVYVTAVDWASYYAAFGMKVEDIYSNLSEEKNEDYRAWVQGDAQGIADSLDPFAQHFIDYVSERRTINLDAGDPFKGRLFLAEDALAIGLIDGIGTIEQAIDGTAASTPRQANTPNNPIEMKIKDFINLFTPGKEMTAETIEQANAALAKANVEAFVVPVTEEVADIQQLTELIDKHATTLAAITERADQAEAQAEAITALLGEEAQAEGFDLMGSLTTHLENSRAHTARIADEGPRSSAGSKTAQEDAATEEVDANQFAHNKEADSMGFGPK